MYSVAKRWRLLRVVAATAFVAVAPIALSTEWLRNAVGMAAPSWALISSMILAPIERHYHMEGLLLQEHFDCDAFGIPWNNALGRRRVDHEVLIVYNRARPRQIRGVDDWYPLPVDADGIGAILACQQGNLVWKRRLHTSYKWFVLAGGTILLGYGLAIAGVKHVTLEDYLIGVALPSVSALILVFESFSSHLAASTDCQRLEQYIDELRQLPRVGMVDVRSIQDRMFELRAREELVPDPFYAFTRKRYNAVLTQVLAERLGP